MSGPEYVQLLQDLKGLARDLEQHKHNVVEAASIATMPRMLNECTKMEHQLQDIREQCEGHRPVVLPTT